jgi:signal transduction histidine kinase
MEALAEKKQTASNEFIFDKEWGLYSLMGFHPIYSKGKGEFLGVIGIDITSKKMSADLLNMKKILIAIDLLYVFISLIISIVLAKTFMKISDVVEMSKNLQRALDELRNLDHGKTEFINIISHELRTPVTVINGYASMLLEELTPDRKDLEGSIREIERSGKYLLGLTNDMVDMSTIELSKLSYTKEKVPLAPVFRELKEKFEGDAAKKSIALAFPETKETIVSERKLVFKVLRHIIDNAIRYTEPNGKVEVSYRKTDTAHVFEVRDTGIGIAESEFENVFKSFYQTESTLNRKTSGSGL